MNLEVQTFASNWAARIDGLAGPRPASTVASEATLDAIALQGRSPTLMEAWAAVVWLLRHGWPRAYELLHWARALGLEPHPVALGDLDRAIRRVQALPPAETACPHCSGHLQLTLADLVARHVAAPCEGFAGLTTFEVDHLIFVVLTTEHVV